MAKNFYFLSILYLSLYFKIFLPQGETQKTIKKYLETPSWKRIIEEKEGELEREQGKEKEKEKKKEKEKEKERDKEREQEKDKESEQEREIRKMGKRKEKVWKFQFLSFLKHHVLLCIKDTIWQS